MRACVFTFNAALMRYFNINFVLSYLSINKLLILLFVHKTTVPWVWENTHVDLVAVICLCKSNNTDKE